MSNAQERNSKKKVQSPYYYKSFILAKLLLSRHFFDTFVLLPSPNDDAPTTTKGYKVGTTGKEMILFIRTHRARRRETDVQIEPLGTPRVVV